jgi:DNA-binding NarL/FixJ family response regulator
MNSEVWLAKPQVAKMAEILRSTPQRPRRPADTLTSRERMIISYLVQGRRNREIGQQLSITEQTVKNHLRSIYDKVGVSDRLELVLYAIHQRIELPPVNGSNRP